MPRNNFASNFKKFGDTLKDAADNVMDKIDDKVDLPIIIDFVAIKKAGNDCYSTARETSGLCKITIEKAHEMVSFGRDLQHTLEDVVSTSSSNNEKTSSSRGGGLDASKFAIIQDLVDGDKIKEATKLARDLSGLSLECVDKSKDMMAAMEQGIDALPDAIEPFVENKLGKAKKKGAKKGDPTLPDVEGSVREIRTLMEDVENVNLFTVVKRGSAAFHGLRKNGELSQDMFTSIQSFADDVEMVSGSFKDFKAEDFKSFKTVGKIRQAASSAWRCLRLSSLIKEFAEQVGELIQWMISLFEIASKKLGAIWGALANAKKVLAVCMESVLLSMKLCDESKEKTLLLKNTSGEICGHLRNMLQVGTHGPKKALKSLMDLADGDEILLCIELGTNIDDIFSDCIKQVIGTINKVDRAISDMPEVLKQDVPKLTPIDDDDDDDDDNESGIYNENSTVDAIEFEDYDFQTAASRSAGDGSTSAVIRSRAASAITKKAGVQNNVRSLEVMTKDIESSSALTVIQRSADGFEGVHETIGKCGDLISNSKGYAQNCKASIESFNHGEWDVSVATQHILEVFAIRDAGKAMRVMAESILELVRANIALMKAVRKRTKGLGSSDGGGDFDVGSLVSSLTNDVDLDDLKEFGKGFKKFGKLFR